MVAIATFGLSTSIVLIVVTLVTSTDIDDWRVSSGSRFDGHAKAPTIKDRAALWRQEDISGANQIGKPLTMHISSGQNNQQVPQQIQRRKQQTNKTTNKRPPVGTRSTQLPGLTSLLIDIDDGVGYPNTCRWISLKEIQRVNFDTGELIIRDASDQPCYIMSLRAFIKFNDDAYFPLRNFRPHPKGAYKIEHSNQTSEPATGDPYKMPLNCSLPEASTSLLIAYDRRPSDYYLFREELTVQLNCGYLVFKMKLDYLYQLQLEAISFFQGGDENSPHQTRRATAAKAAVQKATSNKSTGQIWLKATPMRAEQLIFTTNTSNPDPTPLVSMPLHSRYICNNRIVLTGNNSIQLIIDRFEFNRLVSAPIERVRINHKHRAHAHSITKCPDPIQPATNLTAMMANSMDRNGAEAGEKSAVSNKLVADNKSSATSSPSVKMEESYWFQVLVSIIIAFQFARKLYLADYHISLNAHSTGLVC